MWWLCLHAWSCETACKRSHSRCSARGRRAQTVPFAVASMLPRYVPLAVATRVPQLRQRMFVT